MSSSDCWVYGDFEHILETFSCFIGSFKQVLTRRDIFTFIYFNTSDETVSIGYFIFLVMIKWRKSFRQPISKAESALGKSVLLVSQQLKDVPNDKSIQNVVPRNCSKMIIKTQQRCRCCCCGLFVITFWALWRH